nr:MAG TPA_asm: hypothetical protein [Caudoviricetes sp.]
MLLRTPPTLRFGGKAEPPLAYSPGGAGLLTPESAIV